MSEVSSVPEEALALMDRLRLIDVISHADGQQWPDLFYNRGQQQIAETMYGKQADALLASSWLADHDRAIERHLREAQEQRLRDLIAGSPYFGEWADWRSTYDDSPVMARSVMQHIYGRHYDSDLAYAHCVLCSLFRLAPLAGGVAGGEGKPE